VPLQAQGATESTFVIAALVFDHRTDKLIQDLLPEAIDEKQAG